MRSTLDVQRIPDRLLAVATPLLAAAGWTAAAVAVGAGLDSMAAGPVLLTFYLVLALLGLMGRGGVKLAGLVRLLLGVAQLVDRRRRDRPRVRCRRCRGRGATRARRQPQEPVPVRAAVIVGVLLALAIEPTCFHSLPGNHSGHEVPQRHAQQRSLRPCCC